VGAESIIRQKLDFGKEDALPRTTSSQPYINAAGRARQLFVRSVVPLFGDGNQPFAQLLIAYPWRPSRMRRESFPERPHEKIVRGLFRDDRIVTSDDDVRVRKRRSDLFQQRFDGHSTFRLC